MVCIEGQLAVPRGGHRRAGPRSVATNEIRPPRSPVCTRRVLTVAVRVRGLFRTVSASLPLSHALSATRMAMAHECTRPSAGKQ